MMIIRAESRLIIIFNILRKNAKECVNMDYFRN